MAASVELGEHSPKGKQHLHFWQASIFDSCPLESLHLLNPFPSARCVLEKIPSQVLGLPVYALKIESCAKKTRRIVFASSFLNFLVTWGSSGKLYSIGHDLHWRRNLDASEQ